MKDLLKNRVFKIVVITDVIQQTAIWIRNIALLFFVMEITDSDPIAVSLLTVLEYSPIFVFSFVGGTLADRWNPKKTLITTELLSFISIIVILILVRTGMWQAVFFATFISAIVSQFAIPSSLIMFKRHLSEEQVGSGIAIIQTIAALYIIVGPILGTFIYSSLGINASLITIAIMFLGSAFVQFALPSVVRNKNLTETTLIKELKEGIGYVLNNKNLVIIGGIFAFMGIGQGLCQPLGVYVVVQRLDMDKENLQWLFALTGIGLLMGGVIASMVAKMLREKVVLFVGISILALSFISEVLSTWFGLTISIRFVEGLVSAFLQIVLNTIIIKYIIEEYVGRVTGIITPILTGGVLIGSSLAGVLMKAITLIPTYFIAASILFIGALLSLKLKFSEENANDNVEDSLT